MATRIIHRRGKGIPAASEFASVGEILIDTDTGTGYTLREPDGAVVALGGDGSGPGPGAGMVISPTEPADPVDGMQWLDSTTARVWVWDEDKWLEFPAAGGSVEGSGLIEVSEEPPEPPYEIGQQWFSSTDGYLYIWYGAEWVAIGGAGGGGDGGGSGGGAGDPYWSNVSLLVNAEQGLVDATGVNIIVVNGDVFISGAEVKYGVASVDLTQTGHLSVDGAVTSSLSFTVEAWVYVPSLGSVGVIAAQWRNADKAWTISLLADGTINAVISHDGSSNNGSIITADAVSPNTWHHVALSWDREVYRIFLDGIKSDDIYTSQLAPHSAPTADFTMGARITTTSASQYLNGYLDDVRVTNGVCRYTNDFTPPLEHPTTSLRTVYRKAEPVETQEDGNDADLS